MRAEIGVCDASVAQSQASPRLLVCRFDEFRGTGVSLHCASSFPFVPSVFQRANQCWFMNFFIEKRSEFDGSKDLRIVDW